jgi:hypothetical protein
MVMKFFEVRDRGTLIPWVAFRFKGRSARERALLRRAGFADPEAYVVQGPISGGDYFDLHYNPSHFETRNGRTALHAARYVQANFDLLASGEVVDVEYILGERSAPKEAEV